MTLTLVILFALVILGITNWFMMKGMREQEQVLEANVDRIHAELQDSINVFNRYRN
jgi:Tfp pilus assembly protein PilO